VQLKQLLVLLFTVVALIPASLLTANSAYSFFKLQEQISNLYNGILVIIVGLDDGHLALLQMKSDILSHILTTDPQQMQTLNERIKDNERSFSNVLANYKEIGDFPQQVEIMKRRGLENMTASDHAFITEVRVDWLQYLAVRDNVLSLSGQNRNSEAQALAFGQANTQFDKLIADYQKTVDLNKEIARVLYEESNSVASTAYMYSAVVFALALGIAIVVAALLSKKLTSPIAEVQQEAKKSMDKFTAENAIVESYRHNVDSGLHSRGNNSIMKQKIEAPEREKPISNDAVAFAASRPIETGSSLSAADRERFYNMLSSNQLILLHAESYNTDSRDMLSSPTSKFLRFMVSLSNPNSKDALADPHGTDKTTTIANKKLVLVTRAGSNLKRQVQGREKTEIYLLSLSTHAPITKSTDGFVVISLTNTSIIVEAVRHTLEKNPASFIIFDNITEIAHTIGFDKAHRFIQAFNEVITSFPDARLVLLVNKHAHQPQEIQSIANMFNVFVQ
jgi:hypothetical protein